MELIKKTSTGLKQKPARRRTRRPGAGKTSGLPLPLFAAGLTLLTRLWFIIEMRGTPFSTISPQMIDAWYYHTQALGILENGLVGSEVFFLRPLYPYLLAGVYGLFGRSVFTVQLLQTLLATGSCLLLYDACRRMLNRTTGLIAAFGFAVTGILVFYTGTLLYVEITIFLSLLFTWLLVINLDRWWRWLAAGLSFGLLVISRPEFLLLLPVAVVILLRSGHRVRPLVILTASALAVIALVPLRNLSVSGDPVLFTAHAGINFYYGNNPAADGTWQPTPELESGTGFSHDRVKRTARIIEGRELPWSRASNYWLRRGMHWLAANPGSALELIGRKFLLFWSNHEPPGNYYPETARSRSLILRLLYPVGYGLIAALAVVGLVLAWPLRRRAWPVYTFIAIHILSALAFYVLSRLRAPVLPFMLMFAGYGLTRLFADRKSKTTILAGIAGAAVLAGTLLIPVDRAGYAGQAWTQWGNIQLAERNSGPAFESFRRALEADPTNPSTRYSLIVLLAGSGRIEEANRHYQELTRLSTAPPGTQTLTNLAAARIAIARREFARAASAYQAALATEPDNPETWYMLGLVLIELDNLDQARVAMQNVLALDPGHSEAAGALQLLARRRSPEVDY